jgi:hypothetical protein
MRVESRHTISSAVAEIRDCRAPARTYPTPGSAPLPAQDGLQSYGAASESMFTDNSRSRVHTGSVDPKTPMNSRATAQETFCKRLRSPYPIVQSSLQANGSSRPPVYQSKRGQACSCPACIETSPRRLSIRSDRRKRRSRHPPGADLRSDRVRNIGTCVLSKTPPTHRARARSG